MKESADERDASIGIAVLGQVSPYLQRCIRKALDTYGGGLMQEIQNRGVDMTSAGGILSFGVEPTAGQITLDSLEWENLLRGRAFLSRSYSVADIGDADIRAMIAQAGQTNGKPLPTPLVNRLADGVYVEGETMWEWAGRWFAPWSDSFWTTAPVTPKLIIERRLGAKLREASIDAVLSTMEAATIKGAFEDKSGGPDISVYGGPFMHSDVDPLRPKAVGGPDEAARLAYALNEASIAGGLPRLMATDYASLPEGGPFTKWLKQAKTRVQQFFKNRPILGKLLKFGARVGMSFVPGASALRAARDLIGQGGPDRNLALHTTDAERVANLKVLLEHLKHVGSPVDHGGPEMLTYTTRPIVSERFQ